MRAPAGPRTTSPWCARPPVALLTHRGEAESYGADERDPGGDNGGVGSPGAPWPGQQRLARVGRSGPAPSWTSLRERLSGGRSGWSTGDCRHPRSRTLNPYGTPPPGMSDSSGLGRPAVPLHPVRVRPRRRAWGHAEVVVLGPVGTRRGTGVRLDESTEHPSTAIRGGATGAGWGTGRDTGHVLALPTLAVSECPTRGLCLRWCVFSRPVATGGTNVASRWTSTTARRFMSARPRQLRLAEGRSDTRWGRRRPLLCGSAGQGPVLAGGRYWV